MYGKVRDIYINISRRKDVRSCSEDINCNEKERINIIKKEWRLIGEQTNQNISNVTKGIKLKVL